VICRECAETADYNRAQVDAGKYNQQERHNEDCGCACMHKPAEEWEKQFSVKPPWVVKVQETEVL
jgi:hypothetical protein